MFVLGFFFLAAVAATLKRKKPTATFPLSVCLPGLDGDAGLHCVQLGGPGGLESGLSGQEESCRRPTETTAEHRESLAPAALD